MRSASIGGYSAVSRLRKPPSGDLPNIRGWVATQMQTSLHSGGYPLHTGWCVCFEARGDPLLVSFHIPCLCRGCPRPHISLGGHAPACRTSLPILFLAELRVLQSAGLFPMSWLALRYSPGRFLPRLCLEALGRSASPFLLGLVCVGGGLGGSSRQ